MKRQDLQHASPVLAVIALTLAGLLALLEAERFWMDDVPPPEVSLLDAP
jgi:ABC-type transport system involved in cytochrome c biogenesis permease component